MASVGDVGECSHDHDRDDHGATEEGNVRMTVHEIYSWKSANLIHLFKESASPLFVSPDHLLLQYVYQYLAALLEVLNFLLMGEINRLHQIKLHISDTILDSKIPLGSPHSPHSISSLVELKTLPSHATAT